MLTLEAGQTLQGIAGTATAVTTTLFGDEVGTTDAWKVLYQGQLPAVAGVLYTVAPAKSALIKSIVMVNTTASPVAGIVLYVGGTADVNQITPPITIPAHGSAIVDGLELRIYDAAGAPVGDVYASNIIFAPDGSIISTNVQDAIVEVRNEAQPLDSDLSAIAALTTTSYGRGLLTLANQAALIAEVSSAYQPLDADLTSIAALSTTTFGRAFLTYATAGAAYAALGQDPLSQPLDSDLTAIAALTTTSYGRSLLTSANQSALATALAADAAFTGAFQPLDSDLTAIAALSTQTFGRSLLTGAGASAVYALLGQDPLSQPLDADLTAIAALTTTTYGRSLLTLANQSTLASALAADAAFTAAFQPLDSDLTAIAALATVAYGRSLLTVASQSALATALAADAAFTGAYQPLDADLTSIAALTTTSYGRALLTLANSAALTAAVDAATGGQQGIVTLGAQTLGTGTKTVGGLIVTGGNFQVDSAGRAGFGVAPATDRMLNILNGAHPGVATILYGIANQPIFPATTTGQGNAQYNKVATAAAAFTLPFATGLLVAGPSVGAGSAITSLYGFYIANQGAAGVTNAFGLFIEPTSGASNINAGARIDTGTLAALWLGGDQAGTTQAGGIMFGIAGAEGIYRKATGVLEASAIWSAVNGFRIANAVPTTGHYLRSNGTAFIDGTQTQLTADLNAASTTLQGAMSPTDKLYSDGVNARVFRPRTYSVGNTYDPTGVADSTSTFTALKNAVNAFNDRCILELEPGVFQVDPAVLTFLSTAPFKVRGPGRGVCVLIPRSAGDFITLPAGADGIALEGFAIYNTSTPFTSGSGINTNDADSVTIENMLFVNLFYDIRINGRPTAATTNSTINVSGISPALTAGDVGKPFNGVGIIPGTTIATQAGTTATLSAAATTSATAGFFVGNSIKVDIQRTLHSQTNGNAASVGIRVENGDAGDTYIGPSVVMSNTGATRRRASVELIASGHYEVNQANLTGSAQGILVDPGASQIVAFGFHSEVLCDSCSANGMSLTATLASATIKNIKSANSWYSGTITGGGAGVVTSGAGVINGVTFSMDRFLNNQTHGFQHGAGTDFRFDSCDMKGNSAASANTSDGLNVAAGVSNFSVNGGKYGGTDTAITGNQRYGISVAAGAGNNIKIGADDLSGNATGPLLFGATGVSCFINGCPGLTAPYARGAASASITTVITIANVLIPKNSLRVGTTFRLTAAMQHITTLGADTFTVRLGATNDAVGAAATNGIVVSAVSAGGAANDWVKVEFLVTISAIGGAGNANAQGAGTKALTAFGTATAARASGAGFLAVDTTADRYLTLAVLAAAGANVVYSSTIEVVNY